MSPLSIIPKFVQAGLTSDAAATSCSVSTLPTPFLPGASILSIGAVPVSNSSMLSSAINFCNVSIEYTHPDHDDRVHVLLYLPTSWNGRFQGAGGSGWSTSAYPDTMLATVSQGYAVATTDGGHAAGAESGDWGLLSPGHVNFHLLEDFASVALNDMTLIGKQLTEAYYGNPISKSYWNGCSTGGRQGLMLAQRYPDAYDGILAEAPAINWAHFVAAEFWPQRVMNEANYFPSQCELDAITAAAIEACDALDGLKDGVIGMIGECDFDPKSAVGRSYSCSNTTAHITDKAATIVQSMWDGARDINGKFQWYGLAPGAPLNGLANTTCSQNGTCTGSPFSISTDWHKYFVQKDPDYNLYNMTQAEWDAAFHTSIRQYTSIMGTNNPNLAAFRRSGGKMITWHGMADQLIFFNGTVDYYEHVQALDPHVREYYRFYAAPGVEHCGSGAGAVPTDPLAELIKWVEDDQAPETLLASRSVNESVWEQELCLYPASSKYVGGDPSKVRSFRCE